MSVFKIDVKKYREEVNQLIEDGKWNEAKKKTKEYTVVLEAN